MRAPRGNRANMLGLLATLLAALVSLLPTSPALAEKDRIPTFRGVVITDPSRPPYQIQVVIRPDRDDGGELASQWFTEAGSAVSFEIQMPNVHYQTAGPTFRVEARASGYYPKYERVTLSNCTGAFFYFGCDRAESVTLRPVARYGNIAGTVRYTDGRSVAEAYLSAYAVGAPFPSRSSGTDATGAFSFMTFGLEVPEGRPQDYDVTVLPPRGERFGPVRVTVNGGETTWVELVIPAPPPPENRPRETAQGPPPWNCPECCLLYVGGPVNVTTGNMYTQQEDLAYPSAFGRFTFTRTYNSQSGYEGPLGLGWTHPFDIELQELPSGAIRVRNGAGNVRFYEVLPGSTNSYRATAPARDTSTLIRHAEGFTEMERDGIRRDFGLDGLLQAITTRAGWRTTFGYSDGRLTTITDPGGRTLSFTYDESGRLIRVEGPGALFAEYSYDTQGRLVAVADALGTRWTYAYSDTTPSRLTSVHDANGNLAEEHIYDGEGRVIHTSAGRLPGSVGDIEVKALTLEYLDTSHTRVTDTHGRATTYTFGVYGDLPLVTRVEGPCPCGTPDSTIEYDARGRRVAQTDARGNTTNFEYDAAGNLIQVTDSLEQGRTWGYNAFGQVLTSTDPTGATTTFDYDAATGILLKVTDALGHTTRFSPEDHNLPGIVTNPRGNTTTFAYDDAGLPSGSTDPTGAVTKFAYDAAGHLLNLTDAAGGTTQYRYDPRGRLLTVTDPVGAVTRFDYDAAGNRVGLTNPNGEPTNYVYDAANRLIQVTDPAGGKTTYTYDTENNLLAVADARGNKTTFAYDAHNRLTRRTDPLGASETFGYDPGGNLLTRTDRKGQTINYSYDSLNRLTAKILPDGSAVTYEYDPRGRLLRASDSNGSLGFTYDILGRLLSASSQDGRTLTYSYDAAGNRVSLQDESGHLTRSTYDARNLLTAITDPRTGTFAFQYDPLGRRTRLTRPNRTSTTYTYDAASRLTVVTHRDRWRSFEALTYHYDATGNRTGDARNHLWHQYTYDALDQLTAVWRQGHRGRLHPEEQYIYDNVGNRLTGPDYQAYQYDAANRLTEDRTYVYAYDANGNLIEKRRLRDGRLTSYSYDAEDRLIRVVTPRTEVIFAYDPLGRRIEKRVVRWHDEDGDHEPDPDEEGPPRTIRYFYDQEDILATFDETGREKARYTHGPGIDEPLAEMRRHHTRFYHADMLGSVIALTGAHGYPIRHYRYSAFGIPEDHRWDPQPYRFTGREWDGEIGLYYYRARYQDPRAGRFTSEDRFELGKPNQLYPYVGNNPATLIDPMGLWQTKRVFKGLVALTGGILAGIATAAAAGTTGPVSIPAVLLGAKATSVGIAYGAWEISRGIVEPAMSTAPTIPAPYPSTLVIITATGGNLELADWYNDVTDVASATRTTLNPEKLGRAEWILAQGQLFEHLRADPIYIPGLSEPGGAPWKNLWCPAP